MRDTLLVGYAKGGGSSSGRAGRVEIEVELRRMDWGLELSMCGSVWARDGRDIVMGGQCVDDLWAECRARTVMEKPRYDRIVELWQRWHLNGMRAGCEHQRRDDWKICQGHYIAQDKKPYLRRMREVMKHGGGRPTHCPGDVYLRDDDDGIMITPHIYATIVNCDGVVEDREIEEFAYNVRCSVDKLSVPCPECGYRYGSQWLKEIMPQEVVDEVLRLCWPADVVMKFKNGEV